MLVAVYHCRNHDAMVELLGNLDPGESMQVIDLPHDSMTGEPRYVVIYTTRLLTGVATAQENQDIILKSQTHIH
jgi:hypothetical protein